MKHEWTIKEDEYIEKYYLIKSDKDIANDLHNVTTGQVRSRRIELGFKKQRQTFIKEAPEGMKWCWYCSKFHPIEEFSKNKSKPDGVQDECRRAVKQMVLDRKFKNNKKKNKENLIKEKLCVGCNTTKTIDNFIKNVSTLDGYSNLCIDCLNKNDKLIKKFKNKGDK